MAGDHLQLTVDKDRHVEPELRDVLGKLTELPAAMQARVRRVRPQLIDRPVDD
jgi:hypothetical protein